MMLRCIRMMNTHTGVCRKSTGNNDLPSSAPSSRDLLHRTTNGRSVPSSRPPDCHRRPSRSRLRSVQTAAHLLRDRFSEGERPHLCPGRANMYVYMLWVLSLLSFLSMHAYVSVMFRIVTDFEWGVCVAD